MLRELDPAVMGVETSRETALERLLIEAAESIDLNATQHKEAADSYLAVGKWLDAEDSHLRQFSPLIYAQGSFAYGTAVKPLGRDDFDLDATCVLNIPAWVNQAELKRLVGERLKQNVTYRGILEEKTRCWRLNYAREFHLDIIPAKPKFPGTVSTALLITDKEYKAWKDSDPKEFIRWFNVRKAYSLPLLANRGKQANVEPTPSHEDNKRKTPLQIAIQILKRHRDVSFKGRDDAPISVIITTLAAHAYQQEASVLATARGLLERMPKWIDCSRGYPYVANPTNTNENFADRWQKHPERERAFHAWVAQAKLHLAMLERASGLQNIRTALLPFLGENRTDIIVNRMGSKLTEERATGIKVSTKTGLIGADVGVVVPRASFYGD